jgi:hypothetical protein
MEGGEGGGVANVRKIIVKGLIDWARSMCDDGGRLGHAEASQLRAAVLQAKVS